MHQRNCRPTRICLKDSIGDGINAAIIWMRMCHQAAAADFCGPVIEKQLEEEERAV